MPHEVKLFDDTAPQVAALLVRHWRETPPLQKLAQMSSLNASLEQLALAGLARQFPAASAAELRRRLLERRYGAAVLAHLLAGQERDDAGD